MPGASRSGEALTSHRAIEESLRGDADAVTLVVGRRTPRAVQLASLARDRGIAVEEVSLAELARYGSGARDCVLLLARGPEASGREGLSGFLSGPQAADALVVVLDHITDTRNFGAVLRSADQFAVDAVIVPGRRSAALTGAVVEASAGTARYVRIIEVGSVAAAVDRLKEAGFWVYAADATGVPVSRARLTGRVALVLGSEDRGVSRLVTARADQTVGIPVRGHADSLNVSVAAGILMYETRRQQGWPRAGSV